ncbi:MAG: phospholipid methyltransferase [Desulfobacula sp. RIFOXYA12_FULL_46_16]|nr:MAG: phospholipid methyltransferase [Desulfobacula sp. RIFOXYA12_FULL_46_16]
MGIYKSFVLPKLTHWVCSRKDIARQRRRIVPLARGRVLEIGMGSGLNLPFYNPDRIEFVWGLDPSEGLMKMAEQKAARLPFQVRLMTLSGEDIPLENHSVDTVVVTYTLCSIPDVSKALKEMHRILKPGGRLLFCEHGRSPDPSVIRWQDSLNPLWMKVSGGCHLNRPISGLIQNSRFHINQLDMQYMSPVKLISYNYLGWASPL